jgi:hypothetical protein
VACFNQRDLGSRALEPTGSPELPQERRVKGRIRAKIAIRLKIIRIDPAMSLHTGVFLLVFLVTI